jgi:hypothetical protein
MVACFSNVHTSLRRRKDAREKPNLLDSHTCRLPYHIAARLYMYFWRYPRRHGELASSVRLIAWKLTWRMRGKYRQTSKIVVGTDPPQRMSKARSTVRRLLQTTPGSVTLGALHPRRHSNMTPL